MPIAPRRGFGVSMPGASTVAVKLALALVAGSVLWKALPAAGPWLPLVPELVVRDFYAWQVVSYAFVAASPMGVIFGALIIWQIGGALEATWGGRRLLAFGMGCTIVGSIGTVLMSLVVPRWLEKAYTGGEVLGSVLWVAYGLAYGRRQTNFWDMPVSGNVFALIGVGFVLLAGVFYGLVTVLPDAFAILATFLSIRFGTPRTLWLRLTSWRLTRQLKSRSNHLKIVGKGPKGPSGSDRYIH